MAEKRNLAAAIKAGAVSINLYCRPCCHSKRFMNAHALERWGTDATFPEIARRSKCTKCGQQASQAAPEWPTVGQSLSTPTIIPEGWEDLETMNPIRHPTAPH